MYIDELTRISTSNNDMGGRLASRLLTIINSFKAGEIQQTDAKRKISKLVITFKDLEYSDKDIIINTFNYATRRDTDLNTL